MVHCSCSTLLNSLDTAQRSLGERNYVSHSSVPSPKAEWMNQEWIRKLQRMVGQKKFFLGRGPILGSGTALSASHSLRMVQVES